jgi:hypothetical protein
LSVPEVRQEIELSAEDRRLRRLWAALPAGEAVPEERAHKLICEAAGKWQGDGAFGSGMITILQGMGAVEVNGGAVKRSDTFPILPDLTIGSDAYNELLARENHAAREREIASENQTARQNFEQSPQGRQQRELLELVDERVTERVNAILDERVEDLVERHFAELRHEFEPPAVKGLREKLSAATGGGQEDEQGA